MSVRLCLEGKRVLRKSVSKFEYHLSLFEYGIAGLFRAAKFL